MSEYIITVLLCANMDGSDKMLLAEVTEAKVPLASPYHYVQTKNSSARVTFALFMELLTCSERKMAAKNPSAYPFKIFSCISSLYLYFLVPQQTSQKGSTVVPIH
jgi:hypothetical protein